MKRWFPRGEMGKKTAARRIRSRSDRAGRASLSTTFVRYGSATVRAKRSWAKSLMKAGSFRLRDVSQVQVTTPRRPTLDESRSQAAAAPLMAPSCLGMTWRAEASFGFAHGGYAIPTAAPRPAPPAGRPARVEGSGRNVSTPLPPCGGTSGSRGPGKIVKGVTGLRMVPECDAPSMVPRVKRTGATRAGPGGESGDEGDGEATASDRRVECGGRRGREWPGDT